MGFYFKMFKVAYCVVFILVVVSAVEYSKINEAHYAGYQPDCPKSLKPVVLKPENLNRVTISVGDANGLWTTFNHRNIKELARHSEMDFQKKTFMYVSGYMDVRTLPFGTTMSKAYKNLGYNVLILDTMEYYSSDFAIAARFVRPMGKHVAEMLANLTTLGLDPKKLELVGLSLGGQTMSFIAKNYRHITGRNISSLTALDPAGPCFRHLGPDQRLDPSDADFVLSIATNVDGFGIATPVGHITFYVNGGEYQPGDFFIAPCTLECSHIRAYFLWLAALINPRAFIGMKCTSIQQAKDYECYDNKPMVTNSMDLYADRSKPGVYFLPTNYKYPYALGKKGLMKKHNLVINQLTLYNAADVMEI